MTGEPTYNHYMSRDEPITDAELSDVWWGIARVVRLIPVEEKLLRAGLSVAWATIEAIREREEATASVE